MNHYYTTLAILKAKAGKTADLKEALLKLINPTRNEPGCIEYTLFKNQKEEGTFYMREAFLNEEAFKLHVETAHFKEFAEKAEALMHPLELIHLEQVSH